MVLKRYRGYKQRMSNVKLKQTCERVVEYTLVKQATNIDNTPRSNKPMAKKRIVGKIFPLCKSFKCLIVFKCPLFLLLTYRYSWNRNKQFKRDVSTFTVANNPEPLHAGFTCSLMPN